MRGRILSNLYWLRDFSNKMTDESNEQLDALIREIESDEVVIISKKTHDRMLEREVFLDCLQAAGVDHWEGYDYACRMLNGELEE